MRSVNEKNLRTPNKVIIFNVNTKSLDVHGSIVLSHRNKYIFHSRRGLDIKVVCTTQCYGLIFANLNVFEFYLLFK